MTTKITNVPLAEQNSKTVYRKSTLKSILFCGLIGFSLIGSNEVLGSSTKLKYDTRKWNASFDQMLKDCDLSPEFISKLSDEDSVRISTNVGTYTPGPDFKKRPFPADTKIFIKVKDSTKFPKTDIEKMHDMLHDKTWFERIIRTSAASYAIELFTIAKKCLEEAQIKYMSDATMEQKNKFADLIKKQINCLNVLVSEGANVIRLSFGNYWFIEFNIVNSQSMDISLTKDSKDMYVNR